MDNNPAADSLGSKVLPAAAAVGIGQSCLLDVAGKGMMPVAVAVGTGMVLVEHLAVGHTVLESY